MKKSICLWFALMLLGIFCVGAAVCADETETVDDIKYEALGVSVKDPSSWEGLKGSLVIQPVSPSAIFDDPELYAAYVIYFPISIEELENEESASALQKKMKMAGVLFTVKGDRDQLWEQMKVLMGENALKEKSPEESLVQISEADGYQFFFYNYTNEKDAADLSEEYAEEYNNLSTLITKELEQAEFSAPVDPMSGLVGKTLSFTSTDLDGNTVTSEELFKDNKITMVNLWGVWCINCVNEMEELAAIHERLQEKGCGIVGIEWEEKPVEETYQQARELMEEKGTNYPSVLMPEDNEILTSVNSYPTTFFVDQEGTILTDPIVGAKVAQYEPTLEALLSGESSPETESEEAGTYVYRVFVTDEKDNPLEGAAIQFCDDTSCKLGETDEDGCAVFEVSEEKSYEVHVVEAPDGYAYDEEEVFNTDEKASDITIALKSE